jgi:DNA-binding response OmpR family regulator
MPIELKRKIKKKILIVEDDPFISDIYSTSLTGQGFETELAFNGEEALEKLRKQKFDLMILDVLMPKKDGFAVLKEIRLNPSLKVPVLMLSNLNGEECVKMGMELGAEDFVVKTHFTPQEVVQKIKEIIETKGLNN